MEAIMKSVYYTDARSIKDFKRVGYNYSKIEESESWMVWEMSRGGKPYGWEVWKSKMKKNPDGSRVWAKPSDEDFGVYGWYCTSKEAVEKRKKMIEEELVKD